MSDLTTGIVALVLLVLILAFVGWWFGWAILLWIVVACAVFVVVLGVISGSFNRR